MDLGDIKVQIWHRTVCHLRGHSSERKKIASSRWVSWKFSQSINQSRLTCWLGDFEKQICLLQEISKSSLQFRSKHLSNPKLATVDPGKTFPCPSVVWKVCNSWWWSFFSVTLSDHFIQFNLEWSEAALLLSGSGRREVPAEGNFGFVTQLILLVFRRIHCNSRTFFRFDSKKVCVHGSAAHRLQAPVFGLRWEAGGQCWRFEAQSERTRYFPSHGNGEHPAWTRPGETTLTLLLS